MTFSKAACLIVLSFLPGCFYAQEDSLLLPVKEIQSVYIISPIAYLRLVPTGNTMSKEEIKMLGTDDMGELISKLPGTTIKSYGGLGGLKSVSIRGLGGQHTSVTLDQFEISNAQSGQINFAQVQTEGIENLEILYTPHIMDLSPVSAQLNGTLVRANSFMLGYRRSDSKINVLARYGSFDRKEVYLSGEVERERWHFAGFGKFRDATGNYPFRTLNGNTSVSGIRQNNDYRDFYFGGKIGKTFDGGKINVIYRGSNSTQGLPGAVILYNETADERLTVQDHRVMTEYLRFKGFNSSRVHASAGFNQLNYSDPTYLNAQGFLDQNYQNNDFSIGYLNAYRKKNLTLKWGGEQKLVTMTSNREDLGNPFRASSHVLAGGEFKRKRVVYDVFLGGQFIYDQNQESNVKTEFQLTPIVKVALMPNREKWYLSGWYKRTFRMPSFNELYFGAVGNTTLKPEVAHQINIDLNYLPYAYQKKFQPEVFGSVFFNEVRNKIVAIPTKNLFVWSMQNVEHARIYGASIGSRARYSCWSYLQIEINGSYTWQRVLDVGKESLTYGHQIAYAPEHVGNVDVTFKRKEVSLRISNNAVSSRYALNQNVPQNLLKGYWIMDATLGFSHILPKEDVLSIQLNLKNLWNEQYAFIRSFEMPGRHFLITLNYEIH